MQNNKGEKKHVRYALTVRTPGVPQFECRKRWQDLSDLSRDLYKYDRVLKKGNRWTDHGEKSLAAKWASAGYKPEALDARQSKIEVFAQ